MYEKVNVSKSIPIYKKIASSMLIRPQFQIKKVWISHRN